MSRGRHRAALGSLRARVLATGLSGVLVVAFLFVPQWILVGLSGPSRAVRVWVATAWVGAAFAAAGYAAWRLSAAEDGPPGRDGDAPPDGPSPGGGTHA